MDIRKLPQTWNFPYVINKLDILKVDEVLCKHRKVDFVPGFFNNLHGSFEFNKFPSSNTNSFRKVLSTKFCQRSVVDFLFLFWCVFSLAAFWSIQWLTLLNNFHWWYIQRLFHWCSLVSAWHLFFTNYITLILGKGIWNSIKGKETWRFVGWLAHSSWYAGWPSEYNTLKSYFCKKLILHQRNNAYTRKRLKKPDQYQSIILCVNGWNGRLKTLLFPERFVLKKSLFNDNLSIEPKNG